MALFMLELRLSESLRRNRQLVMGGSSEFASVKAADLSFDLHTRILSPAHHQQNVNSRHMIRLAYKLRLTIKEIIVLIRLLTK